MYRLKIAVLFLLSFAALGPAQAQYFPSPVRIAEMPTGDLVVADSRRQALVIWNPQTATVVGEVEALGRPVSVAYGWGYFFVGNELTQSVDMVEPRKGKLRKILGGKKFHVQRPSDIALDIDNDLVFVTDSATAAVLVFDRRSGDLLRTLPAEGQPPLYRPTGLFVDTTRGEVLVSDFGDRDNPDASINIYDYDGILKASIDGSAGCGSFGCSNPYVFSRPQGLAVNSQGLIYVVDSLLSTVLVFNRETQDGVTTIGIKGKGDDQLWLPLDLVISGAANDLYVTNNRNQRIEIYPGKGLLP